MEAEARYTYVGAALLALIAALVAAIVWLKNVGSKEDFNLFTVYFERQALDGLQVGGDVNLRGIKIGRVEDYSLDADPTDERINRVRVILRIDKKAPIRTNTEAVITRNFVTGIALITLVTRDPPGPPLTEVSQGERYPVIAEGRSDLDEIAGKFTQVGELAAEAMININRVLTPENREAFSVTLRNLRDLTGNLNKRMDALDQTLARAGAAADAIGRAGDRIAGTVEQAGDQAGTTLAEAQRTLAQARAAIKDVAQAAAGLQLQAGQVVRRFDEAATSIDDQLSAAVAELRLSLDAAARTLDRLQDPRGALFGPTKGQLGPGEQLP